MPRRTPLWALHRAAGARFSGIDGWEIPDYYTDTVEEHAAVRQWAGLIDRSHRGKIRVTGRDRATFLHALLTNDINALSPGQGCLAAFLNVQGKVVSLMAAHVLPDAIFLEVPDSITAKTLETFDKFLISEKAYFEEVTERWGIVGLHGPEAKGFLAELSGRAIPELPLYHHAECCLAGLSVRLVRSAESGEEGYDCWVPADQTVALWERLADSGRAHGVSPVGHAAWNVLRVEAGVPWYGPDVDEEVLLLETSLEQSYSLTKGCYVGQEVVARITYRGHVNRKLTGLIFSHEAHPETGARVRQGEREVGQITSAVLSPSLKHPIALAYLRREVLTPGTQVTVSHGGRSLCAEVVSLPFYRP